MARISSAVWTQVNGVATAFHSRVKHSMAGHSDLGAGYYCSSRSGWASLYDVSPDWQPVIGEIVESVFVDAGTSGHGFKLAPALGRHVAELVLGRPDPRLAQFSPARFATGELLHAGYREARILG